MASSEDLHFLRMQDPSVIHQEECGLFPLECYEDTFLTIQLNPKCINLLHSSYKNLFARYLLLNTKNML
jgi:hypothetical protein